ncbi:MAG: hypothetical protein HQ518_27560 [Rhodopirellula sp.]|nr:hypothetical protein [Rhodopirellula sp.]
MALSPRFLPLDVLPSRRRSCNAGAAPFQSTATIPDKTFSTYNEKRFRRKHYLE